MNRFVEVKARAQGGHGVRLGGQRPLVQVEEFRLILLPLRRFELDDAELEDASERVVQRAVGLDELEADGDDLRQQLEVRARFRLPPEAWRERGARRKRQTRPPNRSREAGPE